MSQKSVNIGAFKKDVGLDYDTLKELYMVFVDEIKSEKEVVNRHLALGEIGDLRKAIHNIKGIASSYRAPYIFEHARNLDVKLKLQDFNDIKSYVLDLNERIDDAVREINQYFALAELSTE